MSLAWKAHRLTVLLILVLALALTSLVIGDVMLALPSISGIEGVPARLMLALVGCALVARSTTEAWPATRLVPVRRPGIPSAVAIVIAIGPPALVGGIAMLGGIAAALEFSVVFSWLLALQLAVASTFNATYQAMAPAVYVLLCALLGRSGGVTQTWAWPLVPHVSSSTIALSYAALGLAISLVALRGLREPGR